MSHINSRKPARSKLGGDLPAVAVARKMINVVLCLFALHAGSHLLGKWTTDGR